MKLTNKHKLPKEILRAIENDQYSKGKSTISVSGLLSPPQMRVLNEEYKDQIVVDAVDQVWKILGTASHNILETANIGYDDTITEERMYAQVNGWTISGQTDSISLDDNTLKDYKVTSVWTVMRAMTEGKSEWEQQLNCYAWLCKKNLRRNIYQLQIITINRDWSKNQMLKSGSDYPTAPVSVIDIPLWSEEEQKEFIEKRVNLHQEAEADYLITKELPRCTDEERWKQSDSYRVMKKGRVRAMRVLPTQKEADDYITKSSEKNLSIEFAKGESRRCKDYCDVAPFCDQYKMEIGNNE